MTITIDMALADERLLGAGLGPVESWGQWIAILRAAFGLKLNEHDRKLFDLVAGGREPPEQRVRELWAVVARRSGKSRMAAAIATYLALFQNHRSRLSPGEVGTVLVLAASKAQAKTVYQYVLGFLESSPVLAKEVMATTADEVKLRGGVAICVHSNSYRTIRGKSLIACVFDEAAFWRDELSAAPDLETYRAALPALATTNGMLVAISSPYRKVGLLFQKHRDHYGKNDPDVLVIQGPTSVFNPLIDSTVIDAARSADPEAAASEWDAQFRSDLSQLLDDASIDAAIDRDRPLELPPKYGVTYECFADASAGRRDAFTMCVGHWDQDQFICDAIWGRHPPFDCAGVASDFVALAKSYNCRSITQHYSGEWVAQAFRDAGMTSRPSELSKSQLYLEGLQLFLRGLVSIPDCPQLIRELRLLERRTSRTGKDCVDHGAGGSDDYANVLFGAMRLSTKRKPREVRPMSVESAASFDLIRGRYGNGRQFSMR
jgi:hypothetical protein